MRQPGLFGRKYGLPETPGTRLSRAKQAIIGLSGFLTAVVGLIVVTRDLVEALPSTLDLPRQACIAVGACKSPQPDVPLVPPEAGPIPLTPPPGGVPPGAPRILVLGPAGERGTAVVADVRQRLQAEGLRVAANQDTASLVVELAPIVLDPVKTGGDSATLSVDATLTATLHWNVAGVSNATSLQRKALGFGRTPPEAARNSVAAAAERLSESILQELRRARPRMNEQ